ncbi:protein of unknown function [Duganella sp. CF517]|uniref:DUF748 domain-containing protein n=1 Tax=Duganella sp. CF517 TaxID=1881038 RepID=UPI0008CEFD44|nr:DUF748 domain-containing protein [Duganella sp. CF517]SEN98686.1 protein of unknown function [Duganella sp. CF517]
MTRRWKRWGLGVAGAVGVYALAGGWALPWLIKRQVPQFVETELERKASIGDVSFNPFTLRLEAKDVRVTEADGAPLFGVGALAVEMQWRSLVRRAWSLAEIRVTAPSVRLAISADGKFNIAQLMETLDKRKRDDSDSGMPRLIIEHFALEQGRVEMHDRHAGYNDTFAPIAFELNHLSTLPDENGNYTLSADAGLGGKLRWKGAAALNPIGGSGVLSLENVALPGMSTYLKSFMRVVVSDGRLSARLPYRFGYKDGKLDASLAGASLALNDLAVQHAGGAAPFVKLKALDVGGVGVDLGKRSVEVGALGLKGGALALRRDAQGRIDLANVMVPPSASASAPAPAAKPAPKEEGGWKVRFKQIGLDDIAVNALDETASPALKISTDKLTLKLQLRLETAASGLKLNIDDAAFSMDNLALVGGAMTPLKLGRLGFDDGALDLAARHASLGRLYAEGGLLDLSRDSAGRFLFLDRLPASGAVTAATPAAAPAPVKSSETAWTAAVKTVELSKFGARYDDASTGIKATLQDFNLTLADVGSDLKKPLAFQGGVGLREGGQLTAKGKVVPATGAVDTELTLSKLALAPVQPLLSKYVKLKLADGSLSGEGRLRTGAGGGKANPAVRYDGSFEVAQLALDEEDNDHFARWKSVRADKLALSVSPNLLDVAELRVVEPNAILIIEDDRSLNAQRLLVKKSDPAPPVAATASAAPAASEAFPMRIRRMRFQNAKLDFTDLSLRPQFGAKIYELSGLVTGLSSKADARSQIELDGRVDDFGLARIRGQLNPFVPAHNTDVNVVFKNVDMVSASPYSMKFAGYKIAQGKISLDLQYKVRNSQLEGNNQIVLDNLTLGERIDSPDAIKLPLELALAILKDSDGRIDLGVPVSGNMNDPQFSYGSVVWKAIGNILSKVALSPFRALGNLFGVSGDKLDAVEFDAGGDTVLPPEREKLRQVAKILAGKPQLKLSVPGQYNEAADGAALRTQAVRRLVVTRAEIKLAPDEQPGPLDIGQRKVRGALRDLYAERFGAAELDKQKKAAEGAAGATPALARADDEARSADPVAQKTLPMLQRLGKLVQGEPQVADASAFYGKLQERLEQSQPLPEGALPALGAKRAAAIVAALKEAGVDVAAIHTTSPEKADAAIGKPVALKLALAAK